MPRPKSSVKVCSLLFLCTAWLNAGTSVAAQESTDARSAEKSQLAAVIPNEQTLQGFVKMRPSGEAYLPQVWSSATGKWITPVSEPIALKDDFTPDIDLKRAYGVDGSGSRLTRQLYSFDGAYHLGIEVLDCDTASTARGYIENFRHRSQAVMTLGSIAGPALIGDESWVDASNNGRSLEAGFLIMRVGRLVASISGDISNNSRRQGIDRRFPASAIEAVAYQLLLQSSQHPELTGVAVQQARVDVNGRALPPGAPRVAGQTYVPAQEFARAMGLTSRWDAKAGSLTLSGAGRKTVRVTAGNNVFDGCLLFGGTTSPINMVLSSYYNSLVATTVHTPSSLDWDPQPLMTLNAK